MVRQFTILTLLSFVLAWNTRTTAAVSAPEQAAQKKEDSKKDSKAKDTTVTLTGCIDEQNGQYVMINDRTKDPVADLQADGFETEGFAKHVGHKVTVRGTSSSGETRPIFRVRTIETISETCEPQSPDK
jgi:hypothetical protein